RCNRGRPLLGVLMLVVLHARMLRLVEDRKIKVGKIHDNRLECALFACDALEPLGDLGTNAARAGAADDDIQFHCNSIFTNDHSRIERDRASKGYSWANLNPHWRRSGMRETQALLSPP